MTLRKGHGNGKGVPRIEVLPADELPAGVPATPSQVPTRDAAGRLRSGPGTSELARRAAKAKHEAARLRQLLGLKEFDEDHPYYRYHRLAQQWRDEHMAELSATVGGGRIGPGPASIVSSAALQMAASRYFADLGADLGDPKTLLESSRLADASRQNLLAAHELAAKEAAARPKTASDTPWLVEGDK